MKPFSAAGFEVEDVLQALVLGGTALSRQQGAKKQRRRVPRKQELLVRLVAAQGTVTFEAIQEAFPQEWGRIAQRRRGQPRLLAKRELFRNIADLVGRINAALHAGYQDSASAERILALTGGSYLGLTFDYQAFTVSWRTADSLRKLADAVPQSEGDRHVALQPRGLEATERPRAAPDLPPAATTPAGDTTRLELTVHEDPVTGVWTFELRGHTIEVEPLHGFVKIDGHLHQEPAVTGLDRVEDLAGAPLAAIDGLISRLEDTTP